MFSKLLRQLAGLGGFLSLVLLLSGSATCQEVPQTFGFDSIIVKAKEALTKPFEERSDQVPERWQQISYDEFRSIRFKPECSLFRGTSPFELQFFHVGFLYNRSVQMNIIEADEASVKTVFDPACFSYGFDKTRSVQPPDDGYAGFRVHYPLHSEKYKDELLVFLGASYFKLLGRSQLYGLSARGLAVDTASSSGEEFPFFSKFWVKRPGQEADSLTVYALLESKRVVGAYEFTTIPGTVSELAVRAMLFARSDIDKVGLAPLTSMFLYGENRQRVFDDFRPEVHDSDGLLINTGASEWLWRPLVNRGRLSISSFFDLSPRGFGLLQRDRDFSNYQDLDARYDKRASYWIAPVGDWGRGHVELVEIPSDSETNDNIVAYWVPETKLHAGETREFSYRLLSMIDGEELHPGAKVTSSRIGSSRRPGVDDEGKNGGRLFIVDFVGGDLPFLKDDQPLEGVVSVSSGRVANVTAHRNPALKGWRLFFDFFPEGSQSAELRGFMRLRGRVLTETWSYLWTSQ